MVVRAEHHQESLLAGMQQDPAYLEEEVAETHSQTPVSLAAEGAPEVTVETVGVEDILARMRSLEVVAVVAAAVAPYQGLATLPVGAE